jgi:hypothetical protein
LNTHLNLCCGHYLFQWQTETAKIINMFARNIYIYYLHIIKI